MIMVPVHTSVPLGLSILVVCTEIGFNAGKKNLHKVELLF